MPDSRLIAIDSLANEISKRARVELRPVKIKWYRFAYSPLGEEIGDPELTGIRNFHGLELHEIIMRMYEHFEEPDFQGPSFSQIVPINMYTMHHRPADLVEVNIDMPGYFSTGPKKYSHLIVEEWGMAEAGVFFLSPRVAELLVPHANSHFFSHQPLRLP